jgi:hypothetical protein
VWAVVCGRSFVMRSPLLSHSLAPFFWSSRATRCKGKNSFLLLSKNSSFKPFAFSLSQCRTYFSNKRVVGQKETPLFQSLSRFEGLKLLCDYGNCGARGMTTKSGDFRAEEVSRSIILALTHEVGSRLVIISTVLLRR